jgi:hypothetical protein
VPLTGLTEPRNGIRLIGATDRLAIAADASVADPNNSVVGIILIYRMLGASPPAGARVMTKRDGGSTHYWDCNMYDDHTISLATDREAGVSIVRNLGYHVSLFDNHFHALGITLDDVGKTVALCDEIGTAQSGTAAYTGTLHDTVGLFAIGSPPGGWAVPQPMEVVYTLLTDKAVTTAMLQAFMVGVEGRI